MLWIRMMQQPIFCQTRSFFCHKKNNWRKISRCKSWCQEKSSIQYVSLLDHRSVWRRLGIGEIDKSAAFHASRWYTTKPGLWIRKHLSVSPRPPMLVQYRRAANILTIVISWFHVNYKYSCLPCFAMMGPVQGNKDLQKLERSKSALGWIPFMLSAKWKGNEYHHFEQVRPKMGGNLSQSSRAFSAFEAETCNCLPANSQYVEKLQWPWNSTLYRNSSSTNYFSPPSTEKLANEVNFSSVTIASITNK